jgi:hypothetical protein
VTLGVVIGTIGLMPALPSSMDPSGTAPLPVADPATVPGVGGIAPEAVPPAGEVPPQEPDVAEVPFVDELGCMPLTPPPSKLVLELDPEMPVPVTT